MDEYWFSKCRCVELMCEFAGLSHKFLEDVIMEWKSQWPFVTLQSTPSVVATISNNIQVNESIKAKGQNLINSN